ncbi:MAG: hypothetical protein JWN04_4939 [Myxococcaceae bacterium]|nr:hypothetical protein [Myxococcaceae bacterium]
MIKTLTSSLALAAAMTVSLLAAEGRAQDARVQAQEPTTQDFVARDKDGNLIAVDNGAGFGRKHQWAFSSDSALQIQRRTQSHTPAVTSLSLAPSIDYFVIRNLSVGGVLGLDYSKTGGSHALRFTLGPRVGYNIEISRLLSVWPKIGVSYAHTKSDAGGGTVKGNAAALNLYAPIMIHPAPHFFAGFGPFVDTDLSGNNRATVWGFKLTLGGWVNS